MAVATSTWTSFSAIGQREDLQDVIYEISPTETPFQSNASRGSAKATYHEWQTDALAAANTANAVIEGEDAPSTAMVATTRVGNRLQISHKPITVSGTMDAIDKAGRSNEVSYQVAKAGRELKRDMEAILTGEHAATVGLIGSARTLAGLEAWIVSNYTHTSTNTTGTTPAYSNSPTAGPTDGTTSALTETTMKSVIADVWTAGGDPRMVMVGAANKQVISGFSGIATNYKNVGGGQATIVGAADLYVSDFGEHQIVPNRFSRNRTASLLDMDFWEVAFLRPMHVQDLAKTGDATKKNLVVEYTLVSKNEAASGKVPDLS